MENDLIRRSDALAAFAESTSAMPEKQGRRRIEAIPAVDAVERAVYEQVVWERDIAVKQLADIGKSLGEKMDDVAKVIRCRECYAFETVDYYGGGQKRICRLFDRQIQEDDYCSYGQRREDGDA